MSEDEEEAADAEQQPLCASCGREAASVLGDRVKRELTREEEQEVQAGKRGKDE